MDDPGASTSANGTLADKLLPREGLRKRYSLPNLLTIASHCDLFWVWVWVPQGPSIIRMPSPVPPLSKGELKEEQR